jgi:hypothetical protein
VLSDDQVSAVESTAWFHVGHSPTMLLDTHLRIRAVNKAYETVTGRTHAELVGAALFDAFPDNAADPQNGGGASISSSIETVLRRRVRHVLGVQRYDLPDPADPGTFRYRVWTPVNSPLVIDGATVGVVHRNQDVTTAFPPVPTNGAEAPPQSAALDELARLLGQSFPELPYPEILGIVAESHCVVARPWAGRTPGGLPSWPPCARRSARVVSPEPDSISSTVGHNRRGLPTRPAGGRRAPTRRLRAPGRSAAHTQLFGTWWRCALDVTAVQTYIARARFTRVRSLLVRGSAAPARLPEVRPGF